MVVDVGCLWWEMVVDVVVSLWAGHDLWIEPILPYLTGKGLQNF